MSRREWYTATGAHRWLFWAAPALIVLPLLGSTIPVAAQSSTCSSSAGKCFLATIDTLGPPAFNVSITNEAPTQTLGSADLTVPASFTAISASGLTGSTGSATLSGNLIELRNLGLAPDATVTFTVTATPPEACVSVTYTWGLVAKQSNDFNGPPGNEFVADSLSSLTTTIAGITCHLAFTIEPQDAQDGANISSQAGNPSGPPIEVTVEDPNNATVPVSGMAITLGIESGTGVSGTALGGTTSASTALGVASFAYPTISASGTGYELTATSTGIFPALSSAFSIFDQLTPCTQGSTCTSSESNSSTAGKNNATSVTVSTPGGEGELLAMSLGGSLPLITCSGYTAVSATALTEELNGSGTATVTLYIGKSLVDASPNNGAAFYQICFAYPTLSGQPGATFLLPDCSSTTPAPCVESRHKTGAGVVAITFLVPAGDPFTRG